MSTTFIKAAEFWTPSADGTLLEFGGGLFLGAKRFASISRSMCFARGEGLPGRVWDEARPALLSQFDKNNFLRGDAARAAGFDCAIALPFFDGDTVKAILVLFCGHEPSETSALELWHHDARVTSDMTLVDGAYGRGGQAFEAISRETYLPRGVGLPGLAWQSGEVVFLEDLTSQPQRFLRSEQATEAGLQRGLAIPVGGRVSDCHVAAFLASPGLPIAQRIERWAPDPTKTSLKRRFAFSELHGGSSEIVAELSVSSATSSIVQAWKNGIPALNEQPALEGGAPAAAAAGIGSTALLAIPVVWEGVVSEIVVLYL